MKLVAQSNVAFVRTLVTLLSVLLVFFFSLPLFTQISFAATTSFRSASIITTDGSTSYTNLGNCSATDGNTCDRATDSSYANLYFRDFGDFGIPSGSSITNLRFRATGKATAAIYAGVSEGTSYGSNCHNSSDPVWTMGGLNSSTIATYNATPAFSGGITSCLSLSNIASNNFIFRINYSSGQTWSSNIDNFEIAFDYDPPATPTPTQTPTPTITPTPTPSPTPTLTPTATPTPSPTPTSTPTPTPKPANTRTPTPSPTSSPTPTLTSTPTPTQTPTPKIEPKETASSVLSSRTETVIKKEIEDGLREKCIKYFGDFSFLFFCDIFSLVD